MAPDGGIAMTETRRVLLDGYATDVIRDGDELVAGDGRRLAISEASHLPPCEPTKVIAVHLNYSSRTAEFKPDRPSGGVRSSPPNRARTLADAGGLA